MTRGPLEELVPIENAAMAERTVVEWDKDDLDALGILKVDCLALGMLSAIRRSIDLVNQHTGQSLTLATIPAEVSRLAVTGDGENVAPAGLQHKRCVVTYTLPVPSTATSRAEESPAMDCDSVPM